MRPKGAKSLWEILVPKFSNSNIEFTIEHHKIWDERVVGLAGGETIYKSTKGYWVDPNGRTFSDRMIPVRIYCSERKIERIMDFTKKHYEQNRVMAYKVSDRVKII